MVPVPLLKKYLIQSDASLGIHLVLEVSLAMVTSCLSFMDTIKLDSLTDVDRVLEVAQATSHILAPCPPWWRKVLKPMGKIGNVSLIKGVLPLQLKAAGLPPFLNHFG